MKIARVLAPARWLSAVCAAALIALAPAAANAQTAGVLAGRVTDANNHSPLPGVEVRVAGTALTAASERDGTYTLAGVPAGAQTVTFSYLGYATVSRPVSIGPGATTLDASLGSEVVMLTAFKVEGAREGQARALNQQKSAGNIVNVVAADAIGNFPDKNVAESLQRIPGISTVSERGEPLYVTIRGATPAWNAVSLDGMSLLSANAAHSDALGGDMRSVQLDVFPSSQIGSIEVVKSITADLDADSIGGAVLLKSRSAFDVDRRIVAINAAGSYNDLAGKGGYRTGLTYSDVFGANRDWGVQFSYSREQKNELEESNETNDWFSLTTQVDGREVTGFVPTTALQTFVDDTRDREALTAALEKKIGADGKVFVRAFRNKLTETDHRYGVRYMPGLTATGGNLDATQPVGVSDDGTITEFTSTKASTRRLLQPQLLEDISTGVVAGGTWQAADWGFDGNISYSRATEWFVTDQGQWNSKSSNNHVAFDYTDPTFWQFDQLSGTDFFDPAGLAFKSGKHRENSSRNEEYAAKLDANRTFTIAGTPVKFQAGWKSRWNTKSNDNNVANYNAVKDGTLDLDDARLGGVIDVDPGFLDGHYDSGPYVGAAKWRTFFNANRAPLDVDTGLFADDSGLFKTNDNSRNATFAKDFTIDEDIHAGYVRSDWNWGRLGLIAGVRYERTELDLDAVKADSSKPSDDPSAYTPYRSRSSYDNLLPSILLRYPVSDRFVLRAAWTNTLARPNASDMAPSLSVDPINLTLSGGNPDLHAVEAMNWDVSAEYYLSSVGVLSLGAFRKSLDGPIYESSTAVMFDNGDGPERYIYTTPLNAGHATLSGLELSYQQQLRFLPSPFDGLGFYGNYTLTDSDVDVPERPGEEFTLFNQSKWLGNVALFYQKYNISARLAYTFRSGYITSLIGPGTDTYFDSDHRLDFQLGYKFNQHWTVQFTANNLENSPERQYHGNRSRQEFYGLTGRFYSLGLTWEY
jgi:TonB-dependent receptor